MLIVSRRNYPVCIFLAAFLVISSFCLHTLIAETSDSPAEAVEGGQISTSRYSAHVTYLSHDAMQGRANGSPELEVAAEYIGSQFRIRGLQPGGEDGTYFQTFQLTTGSKVGPGNELFLGADALSFKDDFLPFRFSNSLEVNAPLVFAGYGITAPDMHWDDYRGIDVTDKIVVVFRHEPQEMDEESPFNGSEMTSHASFMSKTVNAKQHGAKAVIFILDPNNHSDDEQALLATTDRSPKDNSGIAAFYVRSEPIISYFLKRGYDLSAIQSHIDTNFEPHSFELENSQIKLVSDVKRERKSVRNVIGTIEGSDPALSDEWIVVGAHYDHLGMGGEYSMDRNAGEQIHNGADDNASGTAGILELARVLSEDRASLKRSLIFIAFAGEELGLLGSNHFVNDPTIALDNAVAMLNFDMIGRLTNNRVFVGGVGTSPNFPMLLTQFNRAIGLDLDYSESGSGSSDHTSFNLKKVPILFFFSGLHGDYHRPSDTAEKINASGARNVLMLGYEMIRYLSNEVERPIYTEVFESRPLSGSGGGYGPYFGSVPDFRDDLGGVLFADVRPGSPAHKSGLLAGDLMVRFGGQPIDNLYDFTYVLRAHKPGDQVVVVVERDNQTISVNVTLEARQ